MNNLTIKDHIIPLEYLEKLAITADTMSSKEICQLTISFNEWLVNAFSDQDVVSKIYFGYRFNPPKLLKKTFDGIKHIFLRDKEDTNLN